MYRGIFLLATLFWCGVIKAATSSSFPPAGMTLPEYWGEENVWWDGRAGFKGEVIAQACTLVMENPYQVIDMGATPVRDLRGSNVGPEKKLSLRLRNCELVEPGKPAYTVSRVRVTFDGVEGETPDRFSLIGQAEGINLKIMDNQGYPARPGKVMPPLLLNDNEEGLIYTLRVVRTSQPLKAGEYHVALRFIVDYE